MGIFLKLGLIQEEWQENCGYGPPPVSTWKFKQFLLDKAAVLKLEQNGLQANFQIAHGPLNKSAQINTKQHGTGGEEVASPPSRYTDKLITSGTLYKPDSQTHSPFP